MKSYTHLNTDERKYLEERLKKGESIRSIARALDRSPSTISREVRRNWSKKANHYHHWHAQTNYIHRRKQCHRKNHLLLDKDAYSFAYNALTEYWSPETIAGRWNLTHENKFSMNSVYRAVKAGLFPEIRPSTHFRRRGKPYSTQKKYYSSHYKESSIHSRPPEIESRNRLGDFEGDTIYGSVGKGYLVTAVDRCSRLLVASIAVDKSAEETNAAFVAAFAKAATKVAPKTLTLDNGSEFSLFKDLEKKLDVKVFFADIHSPWQRGSNENVNGLLRYFFPRGTNFKNVSQDEVDFVVDLINNRPRKCLGFLSPYEFIQKKQSVALGLTI